MTVDADLTNIPSSIESKHALTCVAIICNKIRDEYVITSLTKGLSPSANLGLRFSFFITYTEKNTDDAAVISVFIDTSATLPRLSRRATTTRITLTTMLTIDIPLDTPKCS